MADESRGQRMSQDRQMVEVEIETRENGYGGVMDSGQVVVKRWIGSLRVRAKQNSRHR